MNTHLFKSNKFTSTHKKGRAGAWRSLMLTIIASVSFLFPAVSLAEEIFAELAEDPTVDSTYISGRFAGNVKTWRSRFNSQGLNFGDGFSSYYSYICYSAKSVAKAKAILKDYLKKHPDMEIMMTSREQGGEYVLYEQFDNQNEDKLMRALIWNQVTPENCEIVVVDWKKGYTRGEKYSDGGRSASIITPFKNNGHNNPLLNLYELGSLSDLKELSSLYILEGSLPDLTELSNLNFLEGSLSDSDWEIYN